MEIKISTKNYNISARLQTIMNKKLERLQRIVPLDAACNLVLTKSGKNEIMEMSVVFGGHVYRASEENLSMYNNIDMVIQKVEKQIIRDKEKREY